MLHVKICCLGQATEEQKKQSEKKVLFCSCGVFEKARNNIAF